MLIDPVDPLCQHHDIDDALWARASEDLDDGQILDALALCGWYHAVCFIATATSLQPQPDAALVRLPPK